MSKNSIVILPENVDIPAEVQDSAEIIGLVQSDGTIKIVTNKYDLSGVPLEFANVSEFFSYVGNKAGEADV